jgi:hypothetical protein
MLALYKERHKYKKTNRKRNKNTIFKPEMTLHNCAVFFDELNTDCLFDSHFLQKTPNHHSNCN